MLFSGLHDHHSGFLDDPLLVPVASPLFGSEAWEGREVKECVAKGVECMAMNFQENVTLAMAVLTIIASIYFFNKAQQ
ncbi:small integral membrane protein 47 [Thomomys bottae]